MAGTETPLGGGNMNSGVVRVGDTVRRPAGPWTPAVHALLAHLHAAGFDGAPRPLGIDEQGREVLTFISGPVVWPAPVQRARALDGLVADGLVDALPDGQYALPG